MLPFQKENGARNPGRFSFIRLPFIHHAHGSSSFFRFLTRKQTEVIRFQTD